MALPLAIGAAAGSPSESPRPPGRHPAAPLLDESRAASQVLSLLDARLALMPAVAAEKWRRNLPVADPEREAAVVTAAGAQARAAGLDAAPVERLFELEIARARASQQALHRHWRDAAFDYEGEPADLAAELRPRLDRLTRELIAALYVAAPLLAASGQEEWLAALGRASLPAKRRDAAGRAALLAGLGAVRLQAPPSFARAAGAAILRIGIPADYAPFGIASGELVSGVDVELALGLAAALKLQPVFIRTSWRSLLADLAADRFDLAVGGISVTPARSAVADFSRPTARSGKTAIGRCSDAPRLGSLASLDAAGVRVVENPGGTNEAFARRHLARAQLRIHPDNRTIFAELVAGRADAMFTDETEVELATHRHPQLCRLLHEAFEPADKAILMAKDSGWAAPVDRWLAAELARGVPATLLRDYLAD